MEFEIREGTIDDWREMDRVNRAVRPKNYDENVYRQLMASPTTICFVATEPKPEEEGTTEAVANNADDKIEDEIDDELDEGFEENQVSQKIAGYIIVVLQFDNLKRLSSHIFSIGIAEEFRRNGVGSRLLDAGRKEKR